MNMSDSLIAFLTNVQLATVVLQALCFLAIVVALIALTVTMIYGIKALKLYIAKNGEFKPAKGNAAVAAAPCQCCVEENTTELAEEGNKGSDTSVEDQNQSTQKVEA